MRAKIIQYNPTDGTGVASVQGQQYDFTIRQWKSDTAPATGQQIELTLEDGNVTAIFAVPGDVIAREKATQLANHVGAQLTMASSEGGAARNVAEHLGIPVLIAYAIYVLSVTTLHALSISVFGIKQGITLWNIADLTGQMGGGGSGIRVLLILAFVSIAVPVLWRDKRAWFALLLPAAPLLKLGYDAMSAMSAAKEQMKGMKGLGAAMSNAISNAITVDLGIYGAGIAASVMAFFALKRAFGSTEGAASGDASAASDTAATHQPDSIPPSSAAPAAIVVAACTACQTPFDAGSLFCGNCGQKL